MEPKLKEFGISVFNGDESKFNRWYKKFNNYLKDVPKDLPYETVMEELNRIEYSNFS